jgi:hypothetical protein
VSNLFSKDWRGGGSIPVAGGIKKIKIFVY